MTVPMIKSIGDVPYPIDTHSDAFSPLLTAGAALGITGEATESAAWLQRVSTSDGPTTIHSIHGNTIVQDGALVSVQMEGIETVGFNQFDKSTAIDNKTLGTSGYTDNTRAFCSDYIPVPKNTDYYTNAYGVGEFFTTHLWDADKQHIETVTITEAAVFNTKNAAYVTLNSLKANVSQDQLVLNPSDPTRNGEYAPYWSEQRLIPVGTLRGAGNVYDEQTETERIVRVGVVDLGSLDWYYTGVENTFRSDAFYSALYLGGLTCAKYDSYYNADSNLPDKTISITNSQALPFIRVHDSAYADAAAFKAAMNGVMLHYELATTTTTPYDPPLNLTYRTEHGGTERVMVPTGEQSAPLTIVTAQGYTAESLRDAALSAIAPVENGLASTNYAVGSYLVHDGQLCKVTTAIATGEAITIGTNVTATTAMAEVIALIAQ